MTSHSTLARRLALGLGALLLAPRTTHSQSRQPLQELFFAEVPYLQDKGEFQFTVTHSRFPTAGDYRAETALSVEYGLSDRWQVELEALGHSQLLSTREAHTLVSSVSLSTQRGFTSHDGTFRLLVGAELERPTGTAEEDESATIGPSVAAMKDFLSLHGLRVVASASLAQPIFRTAGQAEAKTESSVQVAAFVPVSITCLTLELHSSSEQFGGSQSSLIAAPGLVIRLPHNFEAAMAAPVSFAGDPHLVARLFRLIYEF